MIKLQYAFHLRDLQFDYDPAAVFSPRSSRYQDMPNNCIFNPYNRYEMVLFITALQQLWSLNTKEDCLKIERLIRTKLPVVADSQINLADWLVLNWHFSESKSA